MMIRKASAADIADLVRLRMEFLCEVNSDKAIPCGIEPEMERYFSTSMQNGSFSAWLAEQDGKIVATSGACYYSITPNFSNPTGKVAYILNMYTLPEHRGKGLATELLARLINEAGERGCRKMALHATPAGRRVYEKLGFRAAEDEMVKWLIDR